MDKSETKNVAKSKPNSMANHMIKRMIKPGPCALTKPSILILLLALAFSACQLKQQDKVANKQQEINKLPNIIWIVSEDNSALIGAYGDTFATTPHLDHLATEGVLYENAFATVPVCAPTRSTLITGLYASSMGTEHMRSNYAIPDMIRFFPRYLKEAGYYTTNNDKKDYNTVDQPGAWDESSRKATYKNRKPGQPFFAVFNLMMSHESSLHEPQDSLRHDPEKVPVPPYHPATAEVKKDWAQYYDKMEVMDAQVGEILRELEEEGLADSTIVFYYSDHGGVLGRSKRFVYESGLHVPLIIRFPEMYKDLSPGKAGSRNDRLVSFVDFAPTILNMAGIPIPEHMQGVAFLGRSQPKTSEDDKGPDYAFGLRGRMDERIDMARSVRDKQYRYIRNYMPHKIYAQHIAYLWKAPSMASWQEAYHAGILNEVQSRFWETKPLEELYDVAADPHNVNNLAADKNYREVLIRMRNANREWLLESKDAGFIPEAMMEDISKKTTLYEFARSQEYPLEKAIDIADLAYAGDIKALRKNLKNQNPILRFWAATGCISLGEKAAPAKNELKILLEDPEAAVRIAAAEALYHLGEKASALATISRELEQGNEMARVQAINVLDIMDQEARPALVAVKAFLEKTSRDRGYDINAAKSLVKKFSN